MLDERTEAREERTPDGRVVYSRLRAEGEEPEPEGGGESEGGAGGGPGALKPRAAGTADPGGVAATLAPLLIAFALLVGLVVGLGYMSGRLVSEVSYETLERERQLAAKYRALLGLQVALHKLNNEARARARVEGNRGLLPPLNVPMRNARREVEESLRVFQHLPLATSAEGQAFLSDAASYLEITDSLDRYSLEGFEAFRKIDTALNRFLDGTGVEQASIQNQLEARKDEARRRIYNLSLLAVLTGLGVAAATTLVVYRRTRQIRRSLEDVRRERHFNAQILEGMVSAIAAVDRHDRIRSANAAFLKIFPGAQPGVTSVHDDFAPPEHLKVLAAATSTRVRRSTYRNRWRLDVGGEERSFDVYSSPLEIDGDAGQLVTLVDVTDAARAEQDLRRQESLAAVGRAAAQVAHEIKNPLGSIRLGVAMLRDMTASAEAHSTIDLVERGIDHLNKLTVDVTQFSRRKELSLSEVDLQQLLDASLDLVADKVREKRASVERRYSEPPVRLEVDADQARQVFVNLFANALDASPEGSPVVVTTERVSALHGDSAERGGDAEAQPVAFARVTVADRGQGMDEKTRARIFEPFFSTKKRGTGLGLAIAKQIVEQHGGRIGVESEPGHGTRFSVELPLRAGG
ncbi:MAG TPA: ATP-binding protein [Pyrinomonadaceae bacterium]|nr:ATP-binding protein [Pyrinomonadaceae bacterium]